MVWEAVVKFAKSLSCVLRQAKSVWKLATHSIPWNSYRSVTVM